MSNDIAAKELDNGVLESGDPQMQPLKTVGTADTITIPKAVFESMYLNPPTPLRNALRNNLGNPTPL